MRRWRRKNGRTRILSVLLCGFMLLGMVAPTVAYAMEALTAAAHTVEGCEGESCAMEGCACECHATAEPTTEPAEERLSEEEILYQLQNGGMTLMALEENGIEVQAVVENANIDLTHFNFVSLNSEHDLNTDMKTTHLPNGVPSGELAEELPQVLHSKDVPGMEQTDIDIVYVRSHVGNTPVYYVGQLTIGEKSYVYYVSDETMDIYTVYSVLRENEKIEVEYQKESTHDIEYQFWDESGNKVEVGPDGWTLDQVFGEDRVNWVASGVHAELNVRIPRGYEVTIKTYHDNNGDGVVDTGESATPFYVQKLGEMQSYKYSGGSEVATQAPIEPLEGSPEATRYTLTRSNDNITQDVVVVCQYKKIESFSFNAWEWYQQQFAYQRIKAIDASGQNPSEAEANFKVTFNNTADQKDGNSYTWYFRGVTAKQYNVSGSRNYTWELDQLEINGTAIDVPTVSLGAEKNENNLPSRTTTLPTGTVVKITITNWGGTNASNGFRDYKIEVTNCFENITITGGNMVSHSHREVAMDKYTGVKGGQYYLQESIGNNRTAGLWNPLQQNTLAARTSDHAYSNPFRYQRQSGYYGKADVTLTDKNGNVIQKNGVFNAPAGFSNSGNQYAIEYLVLKENAETECSTLFPTDAADYGGAPVNRNPNGYMRPDVEEQYDPFVTVSYEEWRESKDGYWYFRMTSSLDNWMKASASHGVVLLSVEGTPLPGAINYVNGADVAGESAPEADDIVGMPSIDLGGETGYDCTMHDDALISSQIPQDRTNQFIFSHWEVLKVDYNGDGFLTGTVSGEALKVDLTDDGKDNPETVIFRPSQGVTITSAFDSELAQGFCWNENAGEINGEPQGRFVITLRAVWLDRSEIEAINYEVRYYVDGDQVQNRTHAVPEGALVVTDLYKTDANGKQVLSDGIQAVLDGDNFDQKKYKGTYVVDERNTTMSIDGVNAEERVAHIYLVRVDMDVIVEKHWKGAPEHFDNEIMGVTVELQHQHVGEGEEQWHKITVAQDATGVNGELIGGSTDLSGRFVLDTSNNFTTTFASLPLYRYDETTGKYDLTKPLRYRTMEVDLRNPGDATDDRLLGTGEIWRAPCESQCTYIVSYEANYTEDMDRKIDITNTYVGSDEPVVVLGKRVSGTTDRDKYFEFKVTIKGSDLNDTDGDGDVTYGDIAFEITGTETDSYGDKTTTAEATVQIKAGGAVFIRGLPMFTDVTIEELLTEKEKGYYQTTISFGDDGVGGESPFEVDESNDLRVNGMTLPGTLQEVIYTNHREAANTITIKKEVTGNMGDQNGSWCFAITLDEPYNQNFGGLPFSVREGYPGTSTALVYLKAGESLDINGLPDGIGYTIRELRGNMDGYDTNYTKTVYRTHEDTTPLETPVLMEDLTLTDRDYTTAGVSGVATLEYDDDIVFTNRKNIIIDEDVTLDSLPYILLLAVTGAGVAFMVKRRRRIAREK